MSMKKIIAFTALALSIAAPISGFAANSATSGAIPVTLTIGGSCGIDASATSGAFNPVVSGIAQPSWTKSTTVSVNCTNTMPYKLGVTGGANYSGSTRALSDSTHADIPYSVKQAGTAFGDADIVNYDTIYLTTSTENAYNGVGSGTAQVIAVDFVAVIPAGQAGGSYTDTVNFVVAWP